MLYILFILMILLLLSNKHDSYPIDQAPIPRHLIEKWEKEAEEDTKKELKEEYPDLYKFLYGDK